LQREVKIPAKFRTVLTPVETLRMMADSASGNRGDEPEPSDFIKPTGLFPEPQTNKKNQGMVES